MRECGVLSSLGWRLVFVARECLLAYSSLQLCCDLSSGGRDSCVVLGQDASTIARDYSAVSVYSIQTTKEFRKLKDHNVDLEHTESILRGPPDPLSGGSLISEPPPQLCGPSCQSSVPPAKADVDVLKPRARTALAGLVFVS